jgi:NAD(P)H-quinone oxidoreductase subunit 6
MARLDLAGVVFAALALLTLGSAVVVAVARDLIRSVVALLGTLVGCAGLYALLAADFVAGAQVLVYAGGTLVLFLFAALLTTPPGGAATANESGPRRKRVGFAIGVFVVGLVAIARDTIWPLQDVAAVPSTTKLGHTFLGGYLLFFELAAVVLFAAILGAVTIGRRGTDEASAVPPS